MTFITLRLALASSKTSSLTTSITEKPIFFIFLFFGQRQNDWVENGSEKVKSFLVDVSMQILSQFCNGGMSERYLDLWIESCSYTYYICIHMCF